MPEFHVFIKRGDARPELDRLVRESGGTAEAAGLHKYIFAAAASHTVAMLTTADAPLAARLRGRDGWMEPGEGGAS